MTGANEEDRGKALLSKGEEAETSSEFISIPARSCEKWWHEGKCKNKLLIWGLQETLTYILLRKKLSPETLSLECK